MDGLCCALTEFFNLANGTAIFSDHAVYQRQSGINSSAVLRNTFPRPELTHTTFATRHTNSSCLTSQSKSGRYLKRV